MTKEEALQYMFTKENSVAFNSGPISWIKFKWEDENDHSKGLVSYECEAPEWFK